MGDRICFDFSNMMAVDPTEELSQAERVLAQLECARARHGWRMPELREKSDLDGIMADAERISREFEAFAVIGIGGSTMGSHAIFTALKHPRYNDLPEDRRGVRFYIVDNSDPEAITALMDVIDPEKTMFNVVTKSGNTVETLAHFMYITDLLSKRLPEGLEHNMIVTTNSREGILKAAAEKLGLKTYCVPENVGGRFSVLSPVGLLPAAVLGVDIPAMLDGAEAMDRRCRAAEDNPALMYAALCCAAMRQGLSINVFMPYAGSLTGVSDWFSQLWAESLAKKRDRRGNTVNVGQTPLRAVGATDQHSQFQLFIEGPFDKMITFLEIEEFRSSVAIPRPPVEMPEVEYLCGQGFDSLIRAELEATAYALTKAGRPNMKIVLSRLSAYTLGALFQFFEIATAIAGELLDIDAFDQPGVESSKVANFALMGKPGYEQKAAEIREFQQDETPNICIF